MQVLDAPLLQDDFYLNLVDWSSQNLLAVGLGSSVYLWSASTSKVKHACQSCFSMRAQAVVVLADESSNNVVLQGAFVVHVHTQDPCPSSEQQGLAIVSQDWILLSKCQTTECHMQVTKLCDLGFMPGEPETQETMCSVGWSQRGTFLALGTSSGETQIWDIHKAQW